MSYEAVVFERFGGLDLDTASDELGTDGAVDLLDVSLDRDGAVRQRDGYAKLTATARATPFDSLAPLYTTGGLKRLVAGRGGTTPGVELLDSAGLQISSQDTTAFPHYFARFGSPTTERVYLSNGTDPIRYTDGATFTSPAGMPAGRLLAVQSPDNRLVSARFQSADGGVSRLQFSAPGDPDTWLANDFLQLTPGDGEEITGMIAWREYLFVFKQTKFFVFYGNDVDRDGNTIFNYRPVDTGVGLAAPAAVCSTYEAVYFLDRSGVYGTQGGEPALVSAPLDPYFRAQNLPSEFGRPALDQSRIDEAHMTAYLDRIHLALPGNGDVWGHDPADGWWTLYGLPASALSAFRAADDAAELVFASTAVNHLMRHASDLTTDDGAAISARYRSGLYDLGMADEKTVRETLLTGSGTVGVALSRDYGALDSATSVALGPTTSRGRVRKAKRGIHFSHQLSSVSGAWTVNRIVQHIRESRPTAVQT